MLGLKTQSNSSARKAQSSHIPWSCRRKGGAAGAGVGQGARTLDCAFQSGRISC